MDATFGDVLEENEKLQVGHKIRNNFATKNFMKNHEFFDCHLFDQEQIEGNYDGYDDAFIMRFLYFADDNINIRPETLDELETKHGIRFDELIELKKIKPELFNGPIEPKIDFIKNELNKMEKNGEGNIR